MTDADISTAIQRNSPKPTGMDYSHPLSADNLARMNALHAPVPQPSALGSFARGFRDNIGAGVGATAATAIATALMPETAGLSGLAIPLIAGLGGGYIGGKGEEAAYPMTPEREQQRQLDEQAHPVASYLGGMAPMVVTMKPGVSTFGKAIGPLGRVATEAEQAAMTAARVNIGAGAGIGAGLSAGLSAAQGQPIDPLHVIGDGLVGAVFNEHNRFGKMLHPTLISTDTQHGVQGDPATGSPVRAGGGPIETNAAVVMPMTGDGQSPSRAFAIMEANALANRLKTGQPLEIPRPIANSEPLTFDGGPQVFGPMVRGPVVEGPQVQGPTVNGPSIPTVGATPPREGWQGPLPVDPPQVRGPQIDRPVMDGPLGPLGPLVQGPVMGDTPIVEAARQTPQALQTEQGPAITGPSVDRPVVDGPLGPVVDGPAKIKVGRQFFTDTQAPVEPTPIPVNEPNPQGLAPAEVVPQAQVLVSPLPVAETPPAVTQPDGVVPQAPEPPQAQGKTPVVPEPPTAIEPLTGSVKVAKMNLAKKTNQLAKLEANGKADPEQITKLRASIDTLNAQIEAAGPAPDSRATALGKRVDEVHNSGEFETINRIRQNGGFAPQDQAVGLIERNAQRGAKLSDQSRRVADGFGESRDDAARPSDFPDTPGGNLAAATLRSLHNKSPFALSVDKLATAMDMTVPEFHANLNAELDSIHKNNGPQANAVEEIYARLERQFYDFEKAVEDAPTHAKATPDELGLEKGDTLTIDGEPLRVVAATDESVTLRDHDKFGDQEVPLDHPIPAENVDSQAQARIAEEAPHAIAADKAMTARQNAEHAAENGAKPAPAAKSSAVTEAEGGIAGHSMESILRAQQKGQLSSTVRPVDHAKAAQKIMSDVERFQIPVAKETVDSYGMKLPDSYKLDGDTYRHVDPADDFALKAHTSDAEIKAENAAFAAAAEARAKAAPVETDAQKIERLRKARMTGTLGDTTADMLDPTAGDTPLFNQRGDAPQQKSLIDGLRAHSNDVQDWINKEKNSGRMNSMPIDILGAQAYQAALDIVVKGLEAGVSIGKAVKAGLAHIEQSRNLAKEEKATIKAALIAKSVEHQRYMGERDAKLIHEMPKIAEELAAQGKTPSVQDLTRALADRFPDHAPYIKANGDKIFNDMLFTRDTHLSRTTASQREWGEWSDAAVDGVRKLSDSITKGAGITATKQTLTKIHANFMTGIGNTFRHLAEGNITGNKSTALARFTEDLVGLAKGADGVHRVSDDLRMDIDIKRFANQLDRANHELAPLLNKMPRGERKAFMERVGDHVTDASRDHELANQPELKRAVESIVELRKDLLKHMRDSGMEVGDAGPRTMRRILDRPTILGNPEEFVKQAANAYKAKWRAETAKLNAEAAGLDPVKDKARLAAIKTDLSEIAGRDAADSARKYMTNIEADQIGITSDGNDLFSHNNGNPNSSKSREFGPEADQLLGKFYRRDPNDILRQEIADAVRGAAVAKSLSGPALDGQGKPMQTGEIDPLAKWKKLRQDLIDEGNSDMVPMAATLLKDFYSLGGSHANPVLRKALGIAHLHGQMTYLARATLSSGGEPALIALRTGQLMKTGHIYLNIARKMVREMRGLGPDEGRIVSNLMGASEDGFNSILASNRFLSGDLWEGKGGELTALLHTKTLLTALTNATHAVSGEMTHSFIRSQLELRAAGGKYKTTAGKALNEIGISGKDIPAMLKFTDDLAKSNDKVGLLTADTPEAKMYRDAMHLVKSSGGSLTGTRGSRPRWGSTPVGSMFYAFQSFLFAFQDQVLSRHYRLMKTAIKGEALVDGATEKLSGAERTQMVGDTLKAAAVIGVAQYGLQVIRENLFSDPARMQDERKTPADIAKMRLLSTATRANIFGGYDILYNMMTGARHGGDPAVRLLGPSLGSASSTVAQLIGTGGAQDSPNTNTHERKTARSLYDVAAKPIANSLFATMPGYAIPALAIQAFNHPGMREAMVKAVAGAPMKQGGPMQKKPTGF